MALSIRLTTALLILVSSLYRIEFSPGVGDSENFISVKALLKKNALSVPLTTVLLVKVSCFFSQYSSKT